MCEKRFLVACVVAFLGSANAATFVLTKCKAEDSKCIKESAQAVIPTLVKGIQELGVESLDPLFYKQLDASSNSLKLILSDITIDGLKDCQIKSLERDAKQHKLFLKVAVTVTVNSHYEVNGSILVLPIKGNGKLHAILRKLTISVEADYVEKERNGKVHWDIKSYKHTYKINGKADLELENLFNGNEAIGKAVRDLLSQSANDVLSEVAPPIVKALIGKVVKVVNQFFKKVPAEDLALD